MIDASNVDQFKVELHGVGIFPVDLKHIVYGASVKSPTTVEEPAPGNTPYLKAPESNVWFKIVPK
jgi:hypothetical protein